MNRGDLISKVEHLAESVTSRGGLEMVEVELKGTGRNQLLRIFIDKPGGVTHADCEFVSNEVSSLIEADDPFPGSWELEVSSPGVERKLKKWNDWERFNGQKAKVVMKQPLNGDLKHFDGVISGTRVDESGAHIVSVELPDGRQVSFPFEQVDRANLKFEW